MSKLAILGGEKTIKSYSPDLLKWPIVTDEDVEAVSDVIRNATMSDTHITEAFEEDFKKWMGVDYALGFNNGTLSIMAALYGAGVRKGDEVICPSVAYWAVCTSLLTLGATPVFADIDEVSINLDPDDIERKISDKTKAIIVVHYFGWPADMDRIMAIAKKHNLKVIEDVSHAQGGHYKGRMCGTIGDVGAMSLMSGKSFAIGEAGMLVTNDRSIYEHALCFCHYERSIKQNVTAPELDPVLGLPLSGIKGRMHQASSAMGRVQIKYIDERMAEIRKAMNYFWDLLEGVPGIRDHRVKEEGSDMAGFYAPKGKYVQEELGGLSLSRFCQAIKAEGINNCLPGVNRPLHHHGLYNIYDVYGDGKPSRIANATRDVRELDKTLVRSNSICARTFTIPWFIKYKPEEIEMFANAFRKVCENYKDLLPGDEGGDKDINREYGNWYFYGLKED